MTHFDVASFPPRMNKYLPRLGRLKRSSFIEHSGVNVLNYKFASGQGRYQVIMFIRRENFALNLWMRIIGFSRTKR